MSPELKATAAFAIAGLVTFVVTPLAIAVAVRTGFYDVPTGYKRHKQPTPYLGGSAIIVGIFAAVMALDGGAPDHPVIVVGAIGIWVIGTIDDRINLPISLRTFTEVGIAVLLWATGRGWGVFHSAPADLILTVVWVVGIMNAFNLMDNMDGAAAATAAVSSVGAGVLALMSGDTMLAPLCFAIAGACIAFLPRNLASRIFMGDGGSLLIGLLVARVTMAAVTQKFLGPSGVIVAALLVGMVIFDTTLVTISRSRARVNVLSGGRDHTTHRLIRTLGTPRRVALTLALAQGAVCAITIAVAQAGIGWVLLTGGIVLVIGATLIWHFERSPLFGRELAPPNAPQVAEPAIGAAEVGQTAPASVVGLSELAS